MNKTKVSIPKLHKIKWKNGSLAENVTALDNHLDVIPVDNVLRGAYEENLRKVVVIGVDQNGEEFLASNVDAATTVYLCEIAKSVVLR